MEMLQEVKNELSLRQEDNRALLKEVLNHGYAFMNSNSLSIIGG